MGVRGQGPSPSGTSDIEHPNCTMSLFYHHTWAPTTKINTLLNSFL